MAGTFVPGQGERCVPIVPTANCHPGIALEQLPTVLPARTTADNGSTGKPSPSIADPGVGRSAASTGFLLRRY